MREPSTPRKSLRSLGLALGAITWMAFAAPALSARIVAVGDVHGSIAGLTGILRSAGLIDGENRWVGGADTLVQTGDLMDRGEHVRAVLDLMMSLEEQASAAGGRVVVLLGNHEVYNLVGYFSSESTPAEFAATVSHFAEDSGLAGARRAEERQKNAYDAWRIWQKRYPGCASRKSRRDWAAEHPPGYLEYIEALGPEGRYGRWLRARRITELIGDTLFVHGGLSPEPPEEFPTDTLDAINAQIKLEIERFDADRAALTEAGVILPFSSLAEVYCAVRAELSVLAAGESPADSQRLAQMQVIHDRLPLPVTWLALHEQGPLWFRGFSNWSDEEGPAELDRVVAAYGVERFVVGHTPQVGGIRARFGDRVFLIDTGMVFGEAAGGRPSALELADEGTRLVYEGAETTPPASAREVEGALGSPAGEEPPATVWLGPDDEPLPFSTPEEMAGFLRTADIESVEDIPVGVTQPKRLMLVRDAVRSKAVFRDTDVAKQRKRLSTGKFVMYFRDSYINEVAAYELSRLLGLDTVPPAVLREVNGERGSVQIWVENTMMETDRREKKIEPPDRLRFTRQFYDMKVFDNLINNIDRNSGNILLDPAWKMWWIDHTRSFARGEDLPAPEDVIGCSRSLLEAIEGLDEEEVAERLGPYLETLQISALLERRRRLIELIEQRVAEKGEDRVLFNHGDPDESVVISYDDIDLPGPEGR